MSKPSDRAAAALRKEAEAALKLERDGHHDEAIARVNDLVARHEGSALVLHLAAVVHDAACRRASGARDNEAMLHHSHTSCGYLTKAKLLVPKCVAISAQLARALFTAGKADEAEKEAREAIDMVSPVDPADNSVVYAFSGLNSTRKERLGNWRNSARQTIRDIQHRRLSQLVREVLEFDTDCHDGARQALKKAKEVAKSYPSSSRAQLLSAHMQLQSVRVLHPDMDRRPFLDRIRAAMKETIASRFGSSLVFAMFHAKLCFVLGLYDAVHFECVRAFEMPEPVDPKLEDVPPDSVQGHTFDGRVLSVNQELENLLSKLFLVADGFRCSMTSDRQDSFLSVRLAELQEYYDKKYENYQWAAETISDALSFVNKNNSWRFWICPSCAGKKFPNPGSLLEHMNSKHLKKLRSVFDSQLCEYVIQDDYLDPITFYQDSEGHHFFRFNKKDYVFAHLSIPTEEMSIAGEQEKACERGKQILEEIKVKLNRLPPGKLRAEFDKACPEIQYLWDQFVKTSYLDYRITIMTFGKPFIWTKLLQSLGEDKAASKISNADIDAIFPNVVDICEVHAEDNVGRLEIDPNSNIADVQSDASDLKYLPSSANENSSSDLLGSSSQCSDETTSISIFRKSIKVLDKDTNDSFILNFIIQILWNWRGFRDEFLKRRPVCTLPSHEGPCISQMLYDIFSCWQKNDHHRIYSLISLRDTICKVLNNSTVFQNVNVNTSCIVTTILHGVRMPGVFAEFNSPVDRKTFETNKLCNKEIICEEFGIKESTTCGNKLDLDSLQIAEVKPFADDKCRQVHPLSVSTTDFSTLAFHTVKREKQDTLREVIINRMTNDPDVFLFQGPQTNPYRVKCTLASMVFYHEGKLLGIARDQNKWLLLVYNNDPTATEFNSWEDLLHDCGDQEVQQGVCFCENVKILK